MPTRLAGTRGSEQRESDASRPVEELMRRLDRRHLGVAGHGLPPREETAIPSPGRRIASVRSNQPRAVSRNKRRWTPDRTRLQRRASPRHGVGDMGDYMGR
jgi:hypothetical protein